MNGKDEIKELFGEKLSGFEANVRPELWSSISSQISTVPAGTGVSLFTKVMIGISAAASVGVLSYYLVKGTEDKVEPKTENSRTENTVNQKKEPSNKKEGSIRNDSVVLPGSTFDGTILPGIALVENSVEVNQDVERVDPPKDQKIDHIQEAANTKVKEEQGTPVTENGSQQNEPEQIIEPPVQQKTEIGSISELFNIFTPNGDGANDVLYVESKDVTDFSVVVIDQQNKIVYQSADADFKWDGTGMNGDPVPAGKYVYYVTARNSAGKVLSKHSVLQITR